MEVKLLTSVVDGSGEHLAGSVLKLPDSEASRLIRIKAAVQLKEEEYEEVTVDEVVAELSKIDGINEEIASALFEKNILSISDVVEADLTLLVSVSGIGRKSAVKIQDSARELLDQ